MGLSDIVFGYVIGRGIFSLFSYFASESQAADIPDAARNVVDYARSKNGAAQPGYKGGRTFENNGSQGGETLPIKDNRGNVITYREYDVNPYTKGQDRGSERVVIGSDGKAYYTNNHYQTFTEIK